MLRDGDVPPTAFYRPELDGLRTLAFLFVYVTHALSDDATYYIRHGVISPVAHLLSRSVHIGRYGVPLFFVLSSYLITELLIRERQKTGTIDIMRFYQRRALRIWPLYFVFIFVVCLLLRNAFGAAAFPSSYLISLLLFSGNWGLIALWGPSVVDKVSDQLWSVSVEEQFYLVWPLLLRLVGVDRIRSLALLLVGAAVAVRAAMDFAGAGEITIWCNSLTWLDSIGAGALLAVCLKGSVPRFKPSTRLLLLVGGPCLWLTAAFVSSKLLPAASIFYPLIVLGSVSLFLSAAGSTVFAHPVLVHLGRRSYGLYVLHMAGLALASFIFPPLSIGNALAGLGLTVLMAETSYRWLEAPFLALKHRFAVVESRPI